MAFLNPRFDTTIADTCGSMCLVWISEEEDAI